MSLDKPKHAGRAAILYHYMYPDDVVSAHHLDGLAQDLAERGWRVEALPCNRGCRDESLIYPKSDHHRGVDYKRIWRPRFSQRRFLGRIANSIWMILSWSAIAFRRKSDRPDVVIIGTDPMFGVAAAIPLRLFASDIRIVHWCFDLHPEAALEQGMVKPRGLIVRLTKRIMKSAYRSCDVIADIGTCMRRRLRAYDHQRTEIELTPWALAEPEAPLTIDPQTRAELFGSAKLGLLYSGNFGEAHDYEVILKLARRLRENRDIHFCFAVRGNRAQALKCAVTAGDTNISFAGFAKLEDLEKRLGSADIHVATLKDKWMGIAVPSKFFGSLSAGRPVLYAGAQESAIGAWIKQHDVGWVIDEISLPTVADSLAALAKDKSQLAAVQKRAFEVYGQRYSRRVVTSEWDSTLSSLVTR